MYDLDLCSGFAIETAARCDDFQFVTAAGETQPVYELGAKEICCNEHVAAILLQHML